jgi:hypothetical protein
VTPALKSVHIRTGAKPKTAHRYMTYGDVAKALGAKF